MSKYNVGQPLLLLTGRTADYTSIMSPKFEWQIHFLGSIDGALVLQTIKKGGQLLTSDMTGLEEFMNGSSLPCWIF